MINILLALLVIIGSAAVFKKAGQPWWGAIIPFYRSYILLKVTAYSTWWLVAPVVLLLSYLLFIVHVGTIIVLPVVIIAGLVSIVVFGLLVPSRLSRVFGHGTGMSLGLIFLPFIFYPILGFDKSSYIGMSSAPATPPVLPMPPTTSTPPTV